MFLFSSFEHLTATDLTTNSKFICTFPLCITNFWSFSLQIRVTNDSELITITDQKDSTNNKKQPTTTSKICNEIYFGCIDVSEQFFFCLIHDAKGNLWLLK